MTKTQREQRLEMQKKFSQRVRAMFLVERGYLHPDQKDAMAQALRERGYLRVCRELAAQKAYLETRFAV